MPFLFCSKGGGLRGGEGLSEYHLSSSPCLDMLVRSLRAREHSAGQPVTGMKRKPTATSDVRVAPAMPD